MKNIIEKLQINLISELEFLAENSSLLLAVSGGADSIAMLDALSLISKTKKIRISVAHFNHGLRPESIEEENFVLDFCKSINVKCFIGKAEVYDNKENLEAWARRNRYEFLENIRKEIDADYVLTAHHKNDLAETVLMRILSGRAAISLGGIKRLDYIKKIFRPMLGITRKQIEEYISDRDLKYAVDNSNLNLDITRNRIRIDVIPDLENKINPGLVDSLCVLADRINSDEESIWDLVNRIYLEADNSKKCDFYIKQAKYIRWRLLKLELEKQLGSGKVGYNSLAKLSEAIEMSDGSSKTIELGWGIVCRFTRKGLLEFADNGNTGTVHVIPQSRRND